MDAVSQTCLEVEEVGPHKFEFEIALIVNIVNNTVIIFYVCMYVCMYVLSGGSVCVVVSALHLCAVCIYYRILMR